MNPMMDSEAQSLLLVRSINPLKKIVLNIYYSDGPFEIDIKPLASYIRLPCQNQIFILTTYI